MSVLKLIHEIKLFYFYSKAHIYLKAHIFELFILNSLVD